MKKINLLIIVIVAVFAMSNLSAQDTKFMISVGGGISMPMGNITKTDYADLSSGFAKTSGTMFSFDGAYKLNKSYGVGLHFSMMAYDINHADILDSGAVDAYAVDEATVTTKGWAFMNILPYFYYSFVSTDKFSLDGRILLGYQSVTTPSIDILLEDHPNHLIQDASTGGGLAYGIGIAGRYDLFKNIGLRLGVDYIMSKPNVTITNEDILNTFPTFRVMTKYNETIGMLNATLAVTYSF